MTSGSLVTSSRSRAAHGRVRVTSARIYIRYGSLRPCTIEAGSFALPRQPAAAAAAAAACSFASARPSRLVQQISMGIVLMRRITSHRLTGRLPRRKSDSLDEDSRSVGHYCAAHGAAQGSDSAPIPLSGQPRRGAGGKHDAHRSPPTANVAHAGLGGASVTPIGWLKRNSDAHRIR